MFLLLICWAGIGLIAGFAGGKMVNLRGDDPRLGIIAGAAGAVVGGGIYHFFSKTPPNATDYMSIVVATLAASAIVTAWFAVRKASSGA